MQLILLLILHFQNLYLKEWFVFLNLETNFKKFYNTNKDASKII